MILQLSFFFDLNSVIYKTFEIFTPKWKTSEPSKRLKRKLRDELDKENFWLGELTEEENHVHRILKKKPLNLYWEKRRKI